MFLETPPHVGCTSSTNPAEPQGYMWPCCVLGPSSLKEARGKPKETSRRASLSWRLKSVGEDGGAWQLIRQQRRRGVGGRGQGTGVNISGTAHAPQPSISLFRKTGYLENLCSLIITLQRRGFHLSYQKNLPVARHTAFWLIP